MPELLDTDVPSSPAQATRRGLLKTLAVLGPVFLGGGGVAAAVSAPKLAPLSVALLLPERSPYPQFAQAFERGFRQGCAAQEMTLRRYSTGPGPRQVQAAAREALASAPQVLVTLGDGLGETLTPVLAQRDVLHLNAEVGVLMARPQHRHPLTLTTSLHAWEAEWALGASLAHSGQKEVHLLFSILDSGYDLPYAFTAGLQSAGGQVTGTTLLGEMDTRAEAQRVVQGLQAENVRTVHVVASEGAPALLAALRQAGMRVSASGLGLGAGAPAGTVGALGSPVQLSGVAAQASQTSPLFALGFDTGAWLSRALEAGTPHLPLALMAAMSTQKFTGVRGPVVPDLQGHLTAALHQMGGQPGSLQRPLATHPGVIAQTQAPRSGWQNTFLHG
jgi:hypothetical protein